MFEQNSSKVCLRRRILFNKLMICIVLVVQNVIEVESFVDHLFPRDLNTMMNMNALLQTFMQSNELLLRWWSSQMTRRDSMIGKVVHRQRDLIRVLIRNYLNDLLERWSQDIVRIDLKTVFRQFIDQRIQAFFDVDLFIVQLRQFKMDMWQHRWCSRMIVYVQRNLNKSVAQHENQQEKAPCRACRNESRLEEQRHIVVHIHLGAFDELIHVYSCCCLPTTNSF